MSIANVQLNKVHNSSTSSLHPSKVTPLILGQALSTHMLDKVPKILREIDATPNLRHVNWEVGRDVVHDR